MRLTTAATSTMLVAGIAASAAAQDRPESSGGGTAPPSWPHRPFTDLEHHGGLRAGIPHMAAIYVGTMQVQRTADGPMTIIEGRTITAVIGTGGVQIGVGTGMRRDFGGSRLEAAVLRTWGGPFIATINQTYVGADYQCIPGALGFSLGAYVRVQGRRDGGNRAFLAVSGVFGI